jgi:hypothetical protein
MTKNVLNKLGFLGVAFVASVGFPLIFATHSLNCQLRLRRLRLRSNAWL